MRHWSVRTYAWLLRLYPRDFFEAYAQEMRWVFEQRLRDTRRRSGWLGALRVWVDFIPDLLVNVVDQHAEEDFAVARSWFSREMSLAGLIGGALWVTGGLALLFQVEQTGAQPLSGPNTTLLTVFIVGAIGFSASLISLYLGTARYWPTPVRLSLLAIPAASLGFLLVLALVPAIPVVRVHSSARLPGWGR